MSEDNDSASGRQVISRAAAVLRALAEDNSGQSLGQIAKKTDLPRTTVHRIVAALEAQQLAATTPAGVRLGQALVRLAASAHTDVVAAARPFVEALGRRLRETVDLCVFRGQHAVSVDQFASDQELRVVAAVGTAYPIHCTAHGKALLARLDDAALEELLGARLERRTASTITARKDLLAQLAEVRTGLGTGPGGTRGRHLRDRRAYRDRPIRAVRAVGRAAGRALRRAARRLPGGLVPVQGRD